MAGITREEFHNFYEESLLPRLEKYEIIRQNNIKVLPKTDKAKSEIFLVFLIFISAILITLILYKTDYSAISKTLMILLICLPLMVDKYLSSKYHRPLVRLRKDLKNNILRPILKLFSFYPQDYNVDKKIINSLGLLGGSSITVSDSFIGNYNGIIVECAECSSEQNFSGLILKIPMNKPFKGKTLIGPSLETKLPSVSIEDVEFMKRHKIYSTDQIEARYLLTTALIERLNKINGMFLGDSYIIRRSKIESEDLQNVEVAVGDNYEAETYKGRSLRVYFENGYVYLFIPTVVNFFEISLEASLLNEDKYWLICQQINLILEIVEYFKLDKDLGL